MFEEFSPEAEQMHTAHAHTVTYAYTNEQGGIDIGSNMWQARDTISDTAAWSTVAMHYSVPTEIEKLDGTKETIYTDNIKVIGDNGTIKLVNDKGESIEIYNEQEVGRKVDQMMNKAFNLSTDTPIDRAFRKQLLEFLKESGF